MRKLIFIFAFIPVLIFGQGTQNMTVKRVKTDSLYIQKLASVSSSNIVLVLDSLTGKIGKRPYPSGGGDSYWQELTGNLANIDTTTGFYVNSTSGVKNTNLSMYPASSWWRIEQSNRTTGVQSVAQGSAGVVSLQGNAGGATDVVQVNGAGYLYGRSGSIGMNLGSSTYRWGTAYLDSITSNKDIIVNGITVGKGRKSTFGSTAIGEGALAANISGGLCTALGAYALYSNTTGQYNAAVGIQSLYANTTGKRNLAFGASAAQNNTTGSHNAAFGDGALLKNTSGNYNIALGDSAGYPYTTLSNRMYLGARDSTTNGIFFNRNTKIGRWNGALIADGTITATGGTSTDWNSAAGWVTTNGANVSNWNTAYGWGNHADGGYLTQPESGLTAGDMWYHSSSGKTAAISAPSGDGTYQLEWSGGGGGNPAWQLAPWTRNGSYLYRMNRVGIGIENPTHWLTVAGAVKSDSTITPLIIGGSAVDSKIVMQTTTGSGTPGDVAWQFKSGTTPLITGLHNGNVGLGVTNPLSALQVAGAITATILSTGNTSIQSNILVGTSAVSGQTIRAGNATGYIALQTGGANDRIRISPTGEVGINTTNPTAKLHVAGNIKATGTGSDSATLSVEKGLRLYGNATVFEDLRIDGQTSRGGPNEPAMTNNFMGVAGMYQRYWQGSAQDDEIFFNVQLPHAWKEGGKLEAHIHNCPWTTPGAADSVVWEFSYNWQNINGTFGAVTTDTTVQKLNGVAQWQHKLVEVANLDTPASGKTLGSVLICRLRRLANSNANDTYTGGMSVAYIDFHYEVDALGSSEELVK